MNYIIVSNGELYHHGVVGMHWGVRRYQNADGSLKAAGRKRYTEGGTDSAKTSKGGKKQLTDEERAARNAKIKKAAIAVGVTALVAAGTYAAVKYNNKTMAEAKQIMSDAHKKKMDEYLEQADKKFQQQQFAASMHRQFDRVHQGDTEAGKAWARAEGEYRTKLNNVLKEKNVYNNAARRHMADKAVQRQAQKEIIKRDLKDTKAKVYSKYREAKGDLPQNVGWYMDRTNKKATKNIANLLNETAYEKELRERAERIAEDIKRRSQR